MFRKIKAWLAIVRSTIILCRSLNTVYKESRIEAKNHGISASLRREIRERVERTNAEEQAERNSETITRALNAMEVREGLGQSLVEPIRRALEYQGVGRRLLMVDEFPEAVLRYHDETQRIVFRENRYINGVWIDPYGYVISRIYAAPKCINHSKRKGLQKTKIWVI